MNPGLESSKKSCTKGTRAARQTAEQKESQRPDGSTEQAGTKWGSLLNIPSLWLQPSVV